MQRNYNVDCKQQNSPMPSSGSCITCEQHSRGSTEDTTGGTALGEIPYCKLTEAEVI